MRNSFHDNSALRLRYQASQRLTNEAVIPRAMLACTRRGRVSRPSIRLSTENKYNQAAFAADKRSRKAECSARTGIQTRVRSQNRNLWSAGDSPFFVDKSPSLQTEAKTARARSVLAWQPSLLTSPKIPAILPASPSVPPLSYILHMFQ